MEKSQPIMKQNSTDKAVYVAFGDSITFGAERSRQFAQMDDPYPKLVGEAFGFAEVRNMAVSGATLCKNDMGLCCMTDRILSYTGEADVISVMLGVNDWARGLPLGSFGDMSTDTVYGCLGLIAEHLRGIHGGAFSFMMTPFKSAQVHDAYPLTDIVEAVKLTAHEYGIPVLDMYENGKYELEMHTEGSDGLHPTQDFIRRYAAPIIIEFLKENYRR